jgi:NitT/TauT family transport system permease protein
MTDQTPAAAEAERPARRPLSAAQRQRRRERMLNVLSPICMILLWELLVRSTILDIRFFPPPSGVVGTFYELAVSGDLWRSLGVSLFRIFIGFIVGAVPGLVVGLTMGLFPLVRAFMEPVVAAIYPIPKLALLPLIMLLFGIGEASKVVTIAIGVFFLVLINTVAGVVNIDRIYLDVAKNYGASRKDFYLTIALPGALPMIFTGLKLGMGMALLLIVAAEMIGAKSGIGYMIWTGYQTFFMERMFVGLTIMAFLGFLFSTTLDELERKIVPWKQ